MNTNFFQGIFQCWESTEDTDWTCYGRRLGPDLVTCSCHPITAGCRHTAHGNINRIFFVAQMFAQCINFRTNNFWCKCTTTTGINTNDQRFDLIVVAHLTYQLNHGFAADASLRLKTINNIAGCYYDGHFIFFHIRLFA